MALIISLTAFALIAGAMWAVLYVSEGDKDMSTAITMAVLPIVLGGLGYYLLRAWFMKVLPEDNDAESLYGQENEEKPALASLNEDASNGEGLSQIMSQVNDDVAQWARDKVNEITLLRDTERFRREYIGNVSHELKTPLNNIQGYIETLIDGGLKDDEINMKYLERTDRNISRLISIVTDLDTISKFESGVMKLNMEDFDLVDVVEEVLDFNDQKASAKHIALKLDNATGKPVMVHADKNRIYEVITNLVVNSINYGVENGSTKVVISDIENKYLIDIADDGIGIDEENLSRVFERFFRVDKSRSRESGGTGLGLAIVKHIMEAHNEMISVKSKIGKGSTFSFTLKKAQIQQ
ncbi:MAG: ATP-binding protein [Bacteroidales bacterium]|nr:ATP-binding protein [Bacteroidales bacterium]MBR4272534.1 ATP-binding protein [Bacteroidales bacterium]